MTVAISCSVRREGGCPGRFQFSMHGLNSRWPLIALDSRLGCNSITTGEASMRGTTLFHPSF